MELLHAVSGTVSKVLCPGETCMDQDRKSRQLTLCGTCPRRRCSSWQQNYLNLSSLKSQTYNVPFLLETITLSGSWSSPYFSSKNLNPTSQKVVVNWHATSSWANSTAITEHFSHLCSLTISVCPLLEPRPSWDSEDLNVRSTKRAETFKHLNSAAKKTLATELEIAQRWQHCHLVLEWDKPLVCWATQKWWYPLKMTTIETGSAQLVCVAASFKENVFFGQRIEERSQEIQWIL